MFSSFNTFGSSLNITNNKVKSNLSNFLDKTPPYAVFRAIDYDASTNTIPEARGKAFTATTSGTITVGDASGNGAGAKIPFLSALSTATINFNITVPTYFTMCNITRYTNATDQTKRKIIIGYRANPYILNGHWQSSRGSAFYGKWITTEPAQNADVNYGNGSLTDWLVMCGKNGSQPTTNILADNNKVGVTSGGVGGQPNLNINIGSEASDFAFNQILVWDKVLTDDEMQSVSNYLTQYLVDGLN